MLRIWPLFLVLMNVGILWVVAGRIASDEALRLDEGSAMAERSRSLDAAWIDLTSADTGVTVEPALRLRLLAHPPPSPEAAALAFQWALEDVSARQVLVSSIEDNPLGALRWWRSHPEQAPNPWADAVLAGALAQGVLKRVSGPRRRPSALGRVEAQRAKALQAWCISPTGSLKPWPICHGRSLERPPDALRVLEDPDIPPQGAVLYVAQALTMFTLETIVDGANYTPRQRRLALLAYGQHGPGPRVEGKMIGWLASENAPFLPVLAALECLRLGFVDGAPIIRAAAMPPGSIEALTMEWAADLLEGEAAYR